MTEQLKLLPLVVKYKPKTLEEVLGRDEIIHELRAYLDQNHIPHLMFEGVQGTGKTLIFNLLIKKYYHGVVPPNNVLKIDASTDNNVDFIRDNLIQFLDTRGLDSSVRKTAFLDEGDYLSKSAQSVLRKPIERVAKKCNIFLACNYANKIILPIQDRFKAYHFDQLSKDAITEGVRRVIDGEGIEIVGDEQIVYDAIYKHSRGTMRYVLNNFLEPARAIGKLTLDSIKLSFDSNTSFIKSLFKRNTSEALTMGIQNPRGCLSGSIDYITSIPDAKLPLNVKSRMLDWITDSYRDMSAGIPYAVTITDLVYKFANTLKPKSK